MKKTLSSIVIALIAIAAIYVVVKLLGDINRDPLLIFIILSSMTIILLRFVIKKFG